jgi:uncharacterized repeat protein (TIGR02543 family)
MMKNLWITAFISIVLGISSCSEDKPDKTVYTVTFDADGGSPVPPAQSVEAGSTVAAPAANPSKAGYVFMFWRLSDKTTAYNFQTPVTADITLRAKWEEEASVEYLQVSWELNGGSWPSTGDNHATQVAKGGTLAEPAAPVKAGDTFEGWYQEAALTNQVSFPYDVSAVTANFTLYAKWITESGNNHNIGSAAEWNAAVAAVNAAGDHQTHTFTITQGFSLPGMRTASIFVEELAGITVTVKGQGSPAPEISLANGSKGCLIYLSAVSQRIVLENIVLKGHATNNEAVIRVGYGGGELVRWIIGDISSTTPPITYFWG